MANKILIIGPEHRNHRGGIGAVIDEHVRLLPEARFYCSYKPFENSLLRAGYGFFRLLLFPFVLACMPQVKVLHVHGASRGSFHRKYLYFLIGKRLFCKKFIYHIHGGEFHLFMEEADERMQKRIDKLILHADNVIVLSDRWRSFFSEKFKMLTPVRVYNPAPSITKRAFKDRKEIRFLFLGKIAPGKGCYDILEAASVLRNSHPGFHVTIGGNGETQKIEATIAQMQLEKHVAFKGWVSGSEKEQLLRDSDVYLLPSYNEGLPVSILEAMSFGMPVIATPVGGIPEMIEDRSSGLLIEPGDVASLVESMRFFLEKPETIKQMGLRAQELICEKFASHVIQAELRELYVKLLKAGRKHGN